MLLRVSNTCNFYLYISACNMYIIVFLWLYLISWYRCCAVYMCIISLCTFKNTAEIVFAFTLQIYILYRLDFLLWGTFTTWPFVMNWLHIPHSVNRNLIHKSHNAPVPYPIIAPARTEMRIFLSWMVRCGMWNRCFVRLVYSKHVVVTHLTLFPGPRWWLSYRHQLQGHFI